MTRPGAKIGGPVAAIAPRRADGRTMRAKGATGNAAAGRRPAASARSGRPSGVATRHGRPRRGRNSSYPRAQRLRIATPRMPQRSTQPGRVISRPRRVLRAGRRDSDDRIPHPAALRDDDRRRGGDRPLRGRPRPGHHGPAAGNPAEPVPRRCDRRRRRPHRDDLLRLDRLQRPGRVLPRSPRARHPVRHRSGQGRGRAAARDPRPGPGAAGAPRDRRSTRGCSPGSPPAACPDGRDRRSRTVSPESPGGVRLPARRGGCAAAPPR